MTIFHACDIRGKAETELTNSTVSKIARALGVKLTGRQVVVGGDIRLSTPRLQHIIVTGLAESGCRVIDIGTVATPVFYYAIKATQSDGGVMVTASHNPAEYNGFKFVFGQEPVSEEDISEIAALVEADAGIAGAGSVQTMPVIEEYLSATAAQAAKGRLRVVLDAGNGATSSIAPALYRRLGYDVVELHCQPDGSFPHRPPNPALAENLLALGEQVRVCGAALGIGFDGDGDRVGVVDEAGQPVNNDDILVLLARSYLEQTKGTIIYDAKCSMVVPEEIIKSGGTPVMARAGHTFSKAAFLREKALFAGEISGHFFFRELGYDDGMFAGLKICEFIGRHGSLSSLIANIPRYFITPDIRVPYLDPDKEAILDAAAQALAQYSVNRIDGVRVEFADGWGMIRSSVTEPLFTLRFEAKTQERLKEISDVLLAALPSAVRTAVKGEMSKL